MTVGVLKAAVDKAQEYLSSDTLPPHWDRDVLFGMNISEVDSDVSDSDVSYSIFIVFCFFYIDSAQTRYINPCTECFLGELARLNVATLITSLSALGLNHHCQADSALQAQHSNQYTTLCVAITFFMMILLEQCSSEIFCKQRYILHLFSFEFYQLQHFVKFVIWYLG